MKLARTSNLIIIDLEKTTTVLVGDPGSIPGTVKVYHPETKRYMGAISQDCVLDLEHPPSNQERSGV